MKSIKLTDFEFSRIVLFMDERYGIDLEKKRENIESRLACDLDKLGVDTYADLLAAIETDPDGDVAQQMVDRLTTNHTYFFRDMESFEHMRGAVLDAVKTSGEPIRIWSAGCSTGQECYTALMVLDKVLCDNNIERAYELMATDICIKSLNIAKAAIYPMSAQKELPSEYFERYCERSQDGSTFSISEKLKSHVRFARLNLMDDVYIENRFNIIFCRNVMIYFKPETREKILNKLYSAVKPGGCLYTGTVELILNSNPFSFLSPAVYLKKERAVGSRE